MSFCIEYHKDQDIDAPFKNSEAFFMASVYDHYAKRSFRMD